MSKIKLLYRCDDYPNFVHGAVVNYVTDYFELITWEPNQTYDPDTVILTTFQQDFIADAWFRPFEQTGHKVIVDHLFDSDVELLSRKLHASKLDLRSPNWMWYNTAMLAVDHGYHTYFPKPNYTHTFLCLMNKTRDHRDAVLAGLAPELAHARWSYVDRGHSIGDANERATSVFWEFYMNPQWYDSTVWSFVVESWMRSDNFFANPTYPNYRTEISEKSYKPLAWFHPMIVCGSVDTLKFLRSQGFETFDNLWSEDYDSIHNDNQRMLTVFDLVRWAAQEYPITCGDWDKITQQKLLHNNHRFFDMALVQQRFYKEIIGDVMEFIET